MDTSSSLQLFAYFLSIYYLIILNSTVIIVVGSPPSEELFIMLRFKCNQKHLPKVTGNVDYPLRCSRCISHLLCLAFATVPLLTGSMIYIFTLEAVSSCDQYLPW